jgi:hypothetical protein
MKEIALEEQKRARALDKERQLVNIIADKETENTTIKREIQKYRMMVVNFIGEHNKDLKKNRGKSSIEAEKLHLRNHA